MIGYSFLINQIIIWISIVLPLTIHIGYFLLWYFLQSFLFLLFFLSSVFLVFSEVLFMLLGICWVASLMYYGKDLFCCIWNDFYNQNIFILSYSGVIRNIKNSFIFIWIGSIFHICFRWYFWNFHILLLQWHALLYSLKYFGRLSIKIFFSKRIMYLKTFVYNVIINLACHGRSTLIFLCPTPRYCCFLERNSLFSYTTDCLCLSIFYLRLYLVSILFRALITVHLFLFFKEVTQ